MEDQDHTGDIDLAALPETSLPASPADDEDIVAIQSDLDDTEQLIADLEATIEAGLDHLRGLSDGTVEPSAA